MEAQWEPLGPIGDTIGIQTEAQGIQKDAKGMPREAKGRPIERLGTSGIPWEHLGSHLGFLATLLKPLRLLVSCMELPNGSLSGPEGRQGEANGSPSGPEGRQGEAKGGQRRLGRLPWEHLGASLVKEDFGRKTSKLAQAFEEK